MAFEEVTGHVRGSQCVNASLLIRLHPRAKSGKRSFTGRLSGEAVKAMRLECGDRIRVDTDPGKAWRIGRVPPGQKGGVQLHVPNNKGKCLNFRSTITQQQAERYFGKSVRVLCEPETYDSAAAVVFLVVDSE